VEEEITLHIVAELFKERGERLKKDVIFVESLIAPV